MVSFFFLALGPIEGHKVQQLLVTGGQIEKILSTPALTPNVKPLGLISTFAPIGKCLIWVELQP